MTADDLPDGLTLTPVAEKETVRLVPSGYLKAPVLDDLIDTPEERDCIANLEMLTSARHTAASRGALLDIVQGELLGERYGWGWTFINAAFCYTRDGGSRFNGPARGAWYASLDMQTAQAEVAWHLARELEATRYFHNVTDYRALLADFIGDFHNAQKMPGGTDFLAEDITVAYPAGQAPASKLRRLRATGLVYPSARNKAGVCLAIFKPGAVQNLKEGALWRFIWDGEREPRIEKVAG